MPFRFDRLWSLRVFRNIGVYPGPYGMPNAAAAILAERNPVVHSSQRPLGRDIGSRKANRRYDAVGA